MYANFVSFLDAIKLVNAAYATYVQDTHALGRSHYKLTKLHGLLAHRTFCNAIGHSHIPDKTVHISFACTALVQKHSHKYECKGDTKLALSEWHGHRLSLYRGVCKQARVLMKHELNVWRTISQDQSASFQCPVPPILDGSSSQACTAAAPSTAHHSSGAQLSNILHQLRLACDTQQAQNNSAIRMTLREQPLSVATTVSNLLQIDVTAVEAVAMLL